MIKLICPVCGTTFDAYESRVRDAKYSPVCSRACLYRGRTLGIIGRKVLKPYSITDEGRAAWRQAAKKRAGTPYKPPVEYVCETCGKRVSIARGKVCPSRKLRFCSPECASVGNSGSGNPAWRGGHDRYYGPDWRAQKRLARKRDGYRCQDCGRTQKDVGRSLDVHHVRRFGSFADSAEANVLDNLVTLCHRCHMLREWREQR